MTTRNTDRYLIVAKISQKDLESLSTRHRQILTLRYKYGVTQREVGDVFGMTRQAIGYVEKVVFKKMRRRHSLRTGTHKGVFPSVIRGKTEDLSPPQCDVDISMASREDLPSHFRGLVCGLGMATIKTMIGNLGGHRLYVPKTVDPSSLLAKRIGYYHACLLSEKLPGEFIYIPSLNTLMTKVRNARIRIDYDGGASYNTLVQNYSLAYRTISSIVHSRQNPS